MHKSVDDFTKVDPAQASFDVICGSSVDAATVAVFDGIAVNGLYGLGDVFDCVDIELKIDFQNTKNIASDLKLIEKSVSC